MKLLARLAIGLVLGFAGAAGAMAAALPVRVVVVTMFETEDNLGELHLWKEKLPADTELPFPLGAEPLAYNADKQVLVVNTGIGTARAATTTTALGLDPRFDLSRAYWLVAGIAGANPNTAPLGSAVWAEWVVDGDLAFQIDGREIPQDWPTGYVPLFETRPYEEPMPEETLGVAYRLNPDLVDWAVGLTKEVELPDPPELTAWRERFAGRPAAALPPQVMKGDTMSSSTFWHGDLFNDWAEDWVKYWTRDAGTFFTSAMEDTGTLAALTALDKAGRADIDRVLVLRTASNFTLGPDGVSAAESLAMTSEAYSAHDPAIAAAFDVGIVVVDALVDGWDRYRDTVPGSE